MKAMGKTIPLGLVQQWMTESATFFTRPVEIFRQYHPAGFQADLIAGLTVAVVMLPQAIAYALIAELPPETGLYAAIVASIVAILWGSSVHLHTGPTNAASLLVLATLLPIMPVGTPEYVAAAGLMAVMVGLMRLLMGLARLGVLVNFVSDSVIIGFTAGAGILISANQIRPLLKLPVESQPGFFATVIAIVTNLSETHQNSLWLGLGTMALVIVLNRYWPKLPAPLLGMIAASIVVAALGLDKRGVVVLGELPRTLPPLASLPLTDFDLMGQMFTGAMAAAAIGLVEAVSITRAIASQSSQRLNSDQEFVGQGLASIAAGFFSGYTCSGSFVRSAVGYSSGAKTPLAVILASLFVLIALLSFAPYAAYLPRAALAGVLIVAAYGMVDRKAIKRIWQASFGDTMIMIATIIATLVLPLQFAVLAGIIVSIMRFLVKTSMPQVQPVVPDESFRHFVPENDSPICPQIGIITMSGPLYFGAAQHIEKAIQANREKHPEQTYLLLRMHLVDHVDVSGIHMLEAIVRQYRQRKGDVYFAGVRRQVKRQMAASGFYKMLGQNHFLQRDEAVSHLFHAVIEPSVCIYECPVRIFAECQALPKWSEGAKISENTLLPPHTIAAWLPSELKKMVSQNGKDPTPLIIDVREPNEFKKGHITEAQLIPLRQLAKKGDTLPQDQPIVLICRIGRRSRLAGGILKDLGYEQVYILQGGILAWEAAGYPLAVE